MTNSGKDVDNTINSIVKRMLATRPEVKVILKPYFKNKALSANKDFCLSMERVNLKKFFPHAKEGKVAFVCFNLLNVSEETVYLKINSDTDVYVNNRLVHSRTDNNEYVSVAVKVNDDFTKIAIKCYCKKDSFGFDYLISTEQYTFMWAKDYLLHIQRTIPIYEYRYEDGMAISELYDIDAKPENLNFVFPPERAISKKKDFNIINENPDVYIGYAYTEIKKDGVLNIYNKSPVKIFINGKLKSSEYKKTTIALKVNRYDTVLIKSMRTESDWGFECDDDLLELSIIESERVYGDKWIMIAGFGTSDCFEFEYGPEKDLSFNKVYRNEFGERLFWRLQDGSYVRPELNSFFFGQWFYALMLGVFGLHKISEYYQNAGYKQYFIDNMQVMANYFEYVRYDWEKFNIMPPFLQRSLKLDHLDPIGSIGMNMVDAYLITSDTTMLTTIYELKEAISHYVPRLENGIINRIETMWADDLFMSVPFLVRLGKLFGSKYYDDAYLQLSEYFKLMFMEEHGVFSHIYYPPEKEISKVAWGRGNGWVMIAFCEFLDIVPRDYLHYSEILELFRKLAKGICLYQNESGIWNNVLNHKETYEETSCTAMFLYSLAKGYRKKLLGDEVIPYIERACEGIIVHCTDPKGNITGVSKGSGCSREWQMYAQLGVITNDDHGTGIVLAALCEYMLYKSKSKIKIQEEENETKN